MKIKIVENIDSEAKQAQSNIYLQRGLNHKNEECIDLVVDKFNASGEIKFPLLTIWPEDNEYRINKEVFKGLGLKEIA